MPGGHENGVADVLRLRCEEAIEGLVDALNDIGDQPVAASALEMRLWGHELLAAAAAAEYALAARHRATKEGR